jgi:hypothetical protein
MKMIVKIYMHFLNVTIELIHILIYLLIAFVFKIFSEKFIYVIKYTF